MSWVVRLLLVPCLVACAVTGAAQTPQPVAPRLRAGATVPLAPPLVVGGGEVLLDVTVGPDGTVSAIVPARTTAPYTELLTAAIKSWKFDPARAVTADGLQPSDGHVLVAAVYRPPQVYLGPTVGSEPAPVARLSPELPAPSAMPMPASYPPQAVRDGVVLVELELTMAGVVRGARVMSSPTPFDSAAVSAVRAWRFDFPPKPSGAPTIYVYAVVGFREPITG